MPWMNWTEALNLFEREYEKLKNEGNPDFSLAWDIVKSVRKEKNDTVDD